MTNLADISDFLTNYLDLNRKPVGVRFLMSQDDFKKSQFEELDTAMNYCTMVRNATLGKSMKSNKFNFSCYTGAKALGIMEVTKLDISGERHAKSGCYKDLCISHGVSKDMVYCQHSAYGVEIGPISEFNDYPDIVLIIAVPYAAMRLIQGYAHHYGQVKNIKMTGMNAVCQECTSYAYETNQLNVSMFCSGCRLTCQWKEEELGIGLPFNKLLNTLDGIIKTSDPMENNKHKRKIKEFLSDKNLPDNLVIGKNYYTGFFRSYSYNLEHLSDDKNE